MTAPSTGFAPRVALASLSGVSDAGWARAGLPHAGGAILGGIALDEPTRRAAREMADRDREEFLPADPFAFIDDQLRALEDAPLRAGFNVRASDPGPVQRAAAICADHAAVCEVNAHCRQDEMCAVGAGESLLADPEGLCAQVATAADTGATTSVKVRAEVAGVDLPGLCGDLLEAGADWLHVDAMDSEDVIAAIAEAPAVATESWLIANNGARDAESVEEYLGYGADAVSVGRASDDPAVLSRVRTATEAWFAASTDP